MGSRGRRGSSLAGDTLSSGVQGLPTVPSIISIEMVGVVRPSKTTILPSGWRTYRDDLFFLNNNNNNNNNNYQQQHYKNPNHACMPHVSRSHTSAT